MQLRNNLKSFTLKELKKEIIKMKANKFAVTRMKRDQVIELIIAYHFLFPHLLINQGTKGQTKKKINYTPKKLAQLARQSLPPNTQTQIVNQPIDPTKIKYLHSLSHTVPLNFPLPLS